MRVDSLIKKQRAYLTLSKWRYPQEVVGMISVDSQTALGEPG